MLLIKTICGYYTNVILLYKYDFHAFLLLIRYAS